MRFYTGLESLLGSECFLFLSSLSSEDIKGWKNINLYENIKIIVPSSRQNAAKEFLRFKKAPIFFEDIFEIS